MFLFYVCHKLIDCVTQCLGLSDSSHSISASDDESRNSNKEVGNFLKSISIITFYLDIFSIQDW